LNRSHSNGFHRSCSSRVGSPVTDEACGSCCAVAISQLSPWAEFRRTEVALWARRHNIHILFRSAKRRSFNRDHAGAAILYTRSRCELCSAQQSCRT
jgi:hypothetical protein